MEEAQMRTTGRLLIVYALLLVVSFAVRAKAPVDRPLTPAQRAVFIPARRGVSAGTERVRVAYRDISQSPDRDPPVILLLHGSPGVGVDFSTLIPDLAARFRVIAPDLPGFGASTRAVPDYSLLAHAAYVVDLLGRLKVTHAHLVGFSMGGGVALNLIDQAPERARSLTMLSAIGVQEMELLGEYRANHVLHAAQLAALWTIREAVPHFGWLDGTPFGVSYARNFYDSDQRPLRGILTRMTIPTQVVHGRSDPLVPVEAALEHGRLVPHSDVRLLDGGHFIVCSHGPEVASLIERFIDRVELGHSLTRDQADADRIAAALRPVDALPRPPLNGIGAVVAAGLIAASALVSVDVAWIAGGVLVGSGRLALATAAVAALLGTMARTLLLITWNARVRANRCFEWLDIVRMPLAGATSILIARLLRAIPPLSDVDPIERAVLLTLAVFFVVRLVKIRVRLLRERGVSA
jgi:pimeloyl-ACP methyl ester carboxylesterase